MQKIQTFLLQTKHMAQTKMKLFIKKMQEHNKKNNINYIIKPTITIFLD